MSFLTYRLPAGSIWTLIVAAILAQAVSWWTWFSFHGGPIFLVPVVLTALPLLTWGRLRRLAVQAAGWSMGAFMFFAAASVGVWYAPSILALIWYLLPEGE
jgi:hypothetical protein